MLLDIRIENFALAINPKDIMYVKRQDNYITIAMDTESNVVICAPNGEQAESIYQYIIKYLEEK